MKKLLLPIISLFAITMSSCSLGSKKVTIDDIEITLPSGFVKADLVNTYYYAQTSEVGFAVVRIESSFGYTATSYLEYAFNNLKVESTIESYESDNLNFKYAYYTNTAQGETYQYFDCVFDHNDYLYDFEFYCKEKKANSYKDKFLDWAKTITFVQEESK